MKSLWPGPMPRDHWISSARLKVLLMRATTVGTESHRIQRLVGIHRHVGVVVGGDLPAGQIDGLEAGLGLLHGLAAGEGAEAVDVGLALR